MQNQFPTNADGLTAKQERFCIEYMKDLNKEKAYIRAGYSGSPQGNVSRLFNKPVVQKRIAELQRMKFEEAKLTVSKVEESLIRIAENAEAEGRYSAAIRAWELLGKYLGMFDQRLEVTVHSDKTEEELDAEIDRLQRMVHLENTQH